VLIAFAVLEERLDAVIVEPGFVPHVSGFDFKRTPAARVTGAQQRSAQKIVEGVAERRPLAWLSRLTRAATSSSSVIVVLMLMMPPV
jgi:hypothetical protein